MTVWVHQPSLFIKHRSRILLGFFVLVATLLVALIFIMSSVQAQTGPSTERTISFSARLRSANGTISPDGMYNVRFNLYSSSNGGTPIWSEAYYDTNGSAEGQDGRAQVRNGYLNVRLGSRTAFGSNVNWNDSLWLTMEIGGTVQEGFIASIPWDGEMSPRIQLGAVPYALNAGLLEGRAAGDFVQLGQGTQTNSSNNPSISINTTGTGNLVQLQRNSNDVFTIDNSGNIAFGGGENQTISINQASSDTDGRTLTITGGDGGSGTTNGGNLVLGGGSGSSGGAGGLVVLTTASFATTTDDSNCFTNGATVSSSCSVTQATVDNSSALTLGFNNADQAATLPDPTLATPGRILYIMASNDSLPFTLIINGDKSLTLLPKSAQTLLWNGSDWLVASGVGSSGNGPQNPEVILDDNDTGSISIEEEPEELPAIEIENTPQVEPFPQSDTPAAQPENSDNTPFRLDNLDTAPIAEPGTMYYDTTLGKIQCYEANGWGNCADAPDTFVTISPEYSNAVMNGTDIGIISSNFCSGTLGINDGSNSQPTVCGKDETYNFYNWTSEEQADQTRSIYLTYELPGNFNNFVPSSTAIMGHTDSSDANVTYQVYRDSGSGLILCGEVTEVASGAQTSWQRGLAVGASDPAECDFEAGDSMLFRINLTAKNQANAYVSNVSFIFRNN